MRIAVIYGSPRKGNTFRAAQIFLEAFRLEALSRKVYDDITVDEIYLPRDLPEFCRGCMTCFLRGETRCPDATQVHPILEQMLAADALLFTTPVYVLQASGSMKNFLDHLGYIFMVHRARPEMFSKKAFILSSTVGAGTRAAIKTISTSLKYWGVNRIYSYGFAIMSEDWGKMAPKRTARVEKALKRRGAAFYRESMAGRRRPYMHTWFLFRVLRMMIRGYDASNLDRQYWHSMGWLDGTASPFRSLKSGEGGES